MVMKMIESFMFDGEKWIEKHGFGRVMWLHATKSVVVKYFTMSGDVMIDAVVPEDALSKIFSALSKMTDGSLNIHVEKAVISRVIINGKGYYYLSIRLYNTQSSEWEGLVKERVSINRLISMIVDNAIKLSEQTAQVLMNTVFEIKIVKG